MKQDPTYSRQIANLLNSEHGPAIRQDYKFHDDLISAASLDDLKPTSKAKLMSLLGDKQ